VRYGTKFCLISSLKLFSNFPNDFLGITDQPTGNLPFLKPDDIQYFDKLLVEVDEETLSPEEQKERKIMKLLLKIKNGTPPMRKSALRQVIYTNVQHWAFFFQQFLKNFIVVSLIINT